MARGTLRIYLGAAPGVGKTYAMLNEGRRGTERGKDVVVGFVECHGRANTVDQIRNLEVVPRRTLDYRGSTFEEMDVDAVLARKPELALVDELAHTNVPGSHNEKRWQDIQQLLDGGVNVVSTLNIQHLESLNDVVERITGIKQRETVPDAVVRAADQIELVDSTPEALRRRLAHGNIYAAEKIDAALANYFRPGNLGALRELALLWVADRVEENLQAYMAQHGIIGPWETRERVLVAVRGTAFDEQLIRRGSRMASRTRGELTCVFVRSGEGLAAARPPQIERDRELTEELGGSFQEIVGEDVARSLVQFARSERVTQMVVGESRRRPWQRVLRGSVLVKMLGLAGPIDVHVISSQKEPEHEETSIPKQRRLVVLPARRVLAGWVLAIAGSPLLTLALAQLRGHAGLPSVLLLFLLFVVAVATVGGTWPALTAALTGSLLVNYYFTPPFYTFTISEAENVLALVVFIAVASVVSALVSTLARRTNEAARARAEADVLAGAAGTLIGRDDAVPALLSYVRSAFSQQSATILRRDADRWYAEASSGEPVPRRPEYGDAVAELSDESRLVLVGRKLGSDDRRVLEAFTAQLSTALRSRELRNEASAAEELAAVNLLRTALLAAVSHDLRTPLSAIKAAVTSLLQRDVEWSPQTTTEFLQTIDAEADRLNKLVGNLLDMSRLQTGGLNLALREVGLEEVVGSALAGLGDRGRAVEVDVPESLPRVSCDAALLERAVANVVENALVHAPATGSVCVKAGAVAGRVLLRVVDRGPGIRPVDREQAFRPFQRLGDRENESGVGLGLAVARGFVEAMGGELALEDTPGGGLTVVIDLKAVA